MHPVCFFHSGIVLWFFPGPLWNSLDEVQNQYDVNHVTALGF